jgi:microcompartment protein CcmL/EutN
MIKLLNIIEEGTLILTPDERQQVEAMIPAIIKAISNQPEPSPGNYYTVGILRFKFADGEDGEATIGVGNFEPTSARGAHWPMDRNNKTDNLILVQQAQFKQYFPSSKFAQKDQELYRTFTGTANTGIERLRQVLKHEIIHAKDPALNHRYSKEPYDSSDESVYYKSWAEFQTFTGQFFESLIAGTDRVLSGVNTAADLKRVESALANILQFFAGKTKTISINTAEFIDGTGSRNIFQKAFNFLNNMIGNTPKSSDFALSEYVIFLNKIKQYNPEGYKEFLKDLYKTIKTIEEKVNSTSPMKIKVQEMKQNINEVKRMQQLAGLLTEAEAAPEQELKNILKADYPTFVQKLGDNINDPKFQAAIKSIASKYPIKTSDISPKVTDLKPTQNEIDVDKSLKFPLTNAQSAAVCLKGGPVSIAGKNIVTGGGGKFIIDGHHRWSQLYCMNPEASITAMDVNNITDPIAGLKATQLGIAGDIGKVPVAKVEGQNLLKMGKDALISYVIKTITPEVLEVFKKANKGSDANAVAEYVWKNVEQMQQNNQPVSGAPGRNIMPQTDDATKWKDDAVNPQAVKEMKRLQQLAGILNEEEANAEQAAEKGLASFEDQLQAFAKTVKPSPKDKKLNEIDPASTLFTLVVGAPGLLTFLGKGADAIGNFFSGGTVKKNMIGQALQKAGHKLEHAYIDGIAAILTGFFPELYANQNQHDETTALHDHCHAIYAALVGAAAIVSGIGASHATGVVQAVEAGATGLKTAEVVALAQKIAAA